MSDGKFPERFVWGAATAAYQIEGAVEQDGRGPSVWDMLCDKDGAIDGGHDGRIACDHYRHFERDVALFRHLGINGYRFSISWPRVLPDGTGKVNEAGIGFYDRLVDSLLAAGIVPFVTLFHWDMPLALFHRGGWLNRDVVDWFGDYTQVVMDALGDRVSHWFTINEPQVFIGHGHFEGRHAPGVRYSRAEMLRCGHHALMAHGRAVQVLRGSRVAAKVGIAPMAFPKIPASRRSEDLEAARRAFAGVPEATHWNLAWWADPVFFGRYPEDGLRSFGKDAPKPLAGDLELVSQPTDMLGLNIYHGAVIAAGTAGEPVTVPAKPGAPMTGFNWPVTPEAMYWGPKLAYERYRKPLYITENGLSLRDWVALDGRVHDPQRIDFLTRYLRELHRAVTDAVPVEGYFHWSALDNFEWADGYRERFGLIYVDYETGERVPKDSYYWYRDVIASNGTVALRSTGMDGPRNFDELATNTAGQRPVRDR